MGGATSRARAARCQEEADTPRATAADALADRWAGRAGRHHRGRLVPAAARAERPGGRRDRDAADARLARAALQPHGPERRVLRPPQRRHALRRWWADLEAACRPTGLRR